MEHVEICPDRINNAIIRQKHDSLETPTMSRETFGEFVCVSACLGQFG